ncbi:2,3-bisphosphoglycerate-dependent phosphoglycerate mutase [Glycine soja]|uniref:phosphoglycerate mutase (2,3-diphosphoglycerate-dependent) n=1 Tax=Glycine soja TaxID=3848 RepID=A0A445JEE9_GLYSO|nr:2,3-bisphosphoglycerate-dependent phosphoglycerate mutase [Glycine soja]
MIFLSSGRWPLLLNTILRDFTVGALGDLLEISQASSQCVSPAALATFTFVLPFPSALLFLCIVVSDNALNSMIFLSSGRWPLLLNTILRDFTVGALGDLLEISQASSQCVSPAALATFTFVLPFLTTHQVCNSFSFFYLHIIDKLIQLTSEAESALILIRHGESLWNEKNLFTGCCDVPLTNRGVEEAIEAGQRISYIPIDMIFTSALIRAQMTAMLAMTQHSQKKVPIIIHDESEQATTWTQVYSEKTTKQSIPVITAWQLNERMYGELQGLNKQETAERYGKEKVHEWRRSFDIPPPKGESLEMCFQRAVPYFKDFIEPQLKSGKHVMVAAHGNSLRSIIMYLDGLTSQEVTSLEISTGIPLLYIYKEGKFNSRGSPVGPTEAGVYAYTQSLAVYRQQLDDMSSCY